MKLTSSRLLFRAYARGLEGRQGQRQDRRRDVRRLRQVLQRLLRAPLRHAPRHPPVQRKLHGLTPLQRGRLRQHRQEDVQRKSPLFPQSS